MCYRNNTLMRKLKLQLEVEQQHIQDDWLISCHVRPEIQIFAVRIMSRSETRWLISASQKVKSSFICNPELESDSLDSLFLKETLKRIHCLTKHLCSTAYLLSCSIFWCISRNRIQNNHLLFGNAWPLRQLSMKFLLVELRSFYRSIISLVGSSAAAVKTLNHHLFCVTVGPDAQEGFPRQLCECVMLIRPTCCDVVKKKSMRRRNTLSPAIRSKSAAAKKESRAGDKGAVWVRRYGFWFLSVEKALKWD